MTVPGPFVHQIDPVMTELGGLYLWYYGLAYTVGFLVIHLWFRASRKRLGLDIGEVYSLSIFVALGVLLGGRLVEVIFYEWAYYGVHIRHIPYLWLGGMSTHGVLGGGIVGAWLFCGTHGRRFFEIADELVIPGALLMGLGRIGNFVDGQIVGRTTDLWWAVKFPDAEGFRHPVVLYDGVKNLLLVPVLLFIRRCRPAAGTVLAHSILWYGSLRLVVDFFREYPTTLAGLATGQAFNLFMSLLGIALLVKVSRRQKHSTILPLPIPEGDARDALTPSRLGIKRTCFALLLILSLTIPSDWTQDVPERYGKRHPGMHHSRLYPAIE